MLKKILFSPRSIPCFILIISLLSPHAAAGEEKAVEKLKKAASRKKKNEKKSPVSSDAKKTPSQEEEKKEAEEIPVIAFKVIKDNFQETIPVMGTISPFEEVELKFEEQGRIRRVLVEEGMGVHRGKILAELNETDFVLKESYTKNKYESEKNLYLSMEKEYELKKRLYDKGAILKIKLEEVELRLKAQRHKMNSARKEWELSQESFKKIRLVAPCDGIVDTKEIEAGEFVTPQTRAIKLIKVDKVYAEVGITEKEIPKIKKGLLATIKVDSYPGRQFLGRIKAINPSLKGFSRTLTLKIEINNKGKNLLPGMFLNGKIVLINLQNVNIVPSKSLIEVSRGVYAVPVVTLSRVYSEEEIDKGEAMGVIEFKQIKLKYKGEDYSAVEGLKHGDLAIVQIPEGQLIPKAKVKIVNVAEYEED